MQPDFLFFFYQTYFCQQDGSRHFLFFFPFYDKQPWSLSDESAWNLCVHVQSARWLQELCCGPHCLRIRTLLFTTSYLTHRGEERGRGRRRERTLCWCSGCQGQCCAGWKERKNSCTSEILKYELLQDEHGHSCRWMKVLIIRCLKWSIHWWSHGDFSQNPELVVLVECINVHVSTSLLFTWNGKLRHT